MAIIAHGRECARIEREGQVREAFFYPFKPFFRGVAGGLSRV